MSMQLILDYLADLSRNNDRPWYHANKERYKQANAVFEQLIGELIAAIGEFDDSIIHNAPKELTFKIVRDTRFSHDKSPYNPTFRAHIAAMGKLPIPVGYYVAIAPGGRSFLGGGLFASLLADATSQIRHHISTNGESLESIINQKNFAEHFTIKGESLKNVPKGYSPEHPQAEYLKYKSWYVEYPIPDKQLADAQNFITQATTLFELMKPFNDYLNSALKGFKMPTR